MQVTHRTHTASGHDLGLGNSESKQSLSAQITIEFADSGLDPLIRQSQLDSTFLVSCKDEKLAKRFNDLVVLKLYGIIDKLSFEPDIFATAPLQDHPYVAEMVAAFEAFGKEYHVRESEMMNLLKQLYPKYISHKTDSSELQVLLNNIVSSILAFSLYVNQTQKPICPFSTCVIV